MAPRDFAIYALLAVFTVGGAFAASVGPSAYPKRKSLFYFSGMGVMIISAISLICVAIMMNATIAVIPSESAGIMIGGGSHIKMNNLKISGFKNAVATSGKIDDFAIENSTFSSGPLTVDNASSNHNDYVK